ncbi:MAG TPA: protein phosphatase 2C domain-containing protein, partial [Pseudomonadales bacterium]|nr:protein phosphatase 2C domain-containing protein [Pseudomonadales bacterium]
MELTYLAPAARLTVGQASQSGVKAVNEDCIGIRVPEQDSLRLTKGVALAIADGVSAASEGRQAAQICVQGLLADYFSTPESWTVKHAIHKVFTALNRWLYAKNQSAFADATGYLTTLSCMVIKSNTAHIFNVGDTRIYRLRGEQLELLTQDHVVKLNSRDTQLTRAMGLDLVVEIEYKAVEIEPHDIFLSCTDGVYRFISLSDLRMLVAAAANDPEAAAHAILERALKNGSDDNLSCQLAHVVALANDNVDDVYARLHQLPLLPPLDPGMKVDGLMVEKTLNENARSSVYQVWDPSTQTYYVLKAPNSQGGDDPSFLERFVLEEWIGKLIRSDQVARVIQLDRPRRFQYYLIEYIEGNTLATWSANADQRDVATVMEWVEQIVKGVRAFHRREALHQDIKPDNLMLDKSGRI